MVGHWLSVSLDLACRMVTLHGVKVRYHLAGFG
jgi:hypothetical protein